MLLKKKHKNKTVLYLAKYQRLMNELNLYTKDNELQAKLYHNAKENLIDF